MSNNFILQGGKHTCAPLVTGPVVSAAGVGLRCWQPLFDNLPPHLQQLVLCTQTQRTG